MAKPAWKLSVRRGSRVSSEGFDDLGEAVERMRRLALEVRAGGPAKAVTMLREFGPGDQVLARLELSSGGLLRRRAAGVDVRGDGAFVPFRGGLRREELDPTDYDSPFDPVREALE